MFRTLRLDEVRRGEHRHVEGAAHVRVHHGVEVLERRVLDVVLHAHARVVYLLECGNQDKEQAFQAEPGETTNMLL